MIQIKKLRKKDLIILKKHWGVYEPFLDRYSSMIQGKSIFLIMWLDEKPIGHSRLWLEPIAVIEDMYINENYRSKGYGTILLKRTELYTRRKKCNQVKLLVGIKNKKAEKFYLENNYLLTGKIFNNEKEMFKNLK